MRRLLATLMLIALTASCGKKGAPTPPVPIIPQGTSDLVVTQRGTRMILSWSYPSLTSAGGPLEKVERILIYRYVEQLPPALAGRDPVTLQTGEAAPQVPREIGLFATLPLIPPTQFAKLKERLDSIKGADLPRYTEGARVVYVDEPALRTTDNRPVRLTYSVVAETPGGKSDLSNLGVIVAVDPPAAPGSFSQRAVAEGVKLEWEAPKKTVSGHEQPVVIGYNLYRLMPDEQTLTSSPVNQAPVTATNYLDAPSYGSYRYAVVAVASNGPPRIESDTAESTTIVFRDLQPPAVPVGLVALSEDAGVRLVWDPVESTDLAGYKVYRRSGSVDLALTSASIEESFYRDATAVRGVSYVYRVTSVDKSGNESAPAETGEVMLRRE